MTTKTTAEILEESLQAANSARTAALNKMQVPSWLPGFLAFDLDDDKIPDILELHMWNEAMSVLIWALMTFASPNTIAYKAAVKVQAAREAAIAAGYLPKK